MVDVDRICLFFFQEVLNTFHIHRISFISHDPDDSRVFALIDGVKGDPGYTLHAYKSEKTVRTNIILVYVGDGDML